MTNSSGAAVSEQQRAKRIALEGLAIRVLDRRDVRAVDGERRERLFEAGCVAEPSQSVDLRRERRVHLLALCLDWREGLGVERGEGGLPGRIHEQRRRVVQELVPHRPLDRPVAQRLARIEDLLHPDPLHALGAQPAQVAGRVGEPVRVVHAQPVHEPLAHQAQRQPVRLGEHLRVLLPHAGQVVDVEEAPVPPGLRIDVEEPRAQLRIGPVAVRLVGRHVVRDDVEDHAEPGLRELPELLLAAQLLGDPARVGHVVAVRGARPRLKAGRQVEVADAELREVGHEGARGGEVELRAELEPVGGPQLGHVSRRSTTSERPGRRTSSRVR